MVVGGDAAVDPRPGAQLQGTRHRAEGVHEPVSQSVLVLEEGYREFERGLREIGCPRQEAHFAVNRTTFVGETQADVDAALADVLRIHRGLYAQLEGNELYVNGKIQIKPVQHEIGGDEVIANVPFGDVEHVRNQVRPYRDLGVDHLSLYFDFGMDQERVLRSMRLFATEVMPEFHGAVAGVGETT